MKVNEVSKGLRRFYFGKQGFTLLELVVVIVLVGILSLFTGTIILYEIDQYRFLARSQRDLQNSRMMVRVMTRDLRQITSADSILHADTDSLRFYNVDGEIVAYRFSNSRLVRNGDLMMNAVSEFEFGFFDADGSAISSPVSEPEDIYSISFAVTTTSNGRPLTFSTRVQPRNFW